MKLIGVISDTHIHGGSTRALPEQVYAAFENVEMILHGGDLTAPSVLDALNLLAPTIAVRGNNDYGALANLPISRRVEIENVVIGMTHGDKPANNVRVSKLTDAPGNSQAAADAISHFEFDGDVNCILFGHSHRALLQEREINGRGVLLLNPGSPTDRRWSPHFGCALLKIDGDKIEPQLITW